MRNVCVDLMYGVELCRIVLCVCYSYQYGPRPAIPDWKKSAAWRRGSVLGS